MTAAAAVATIESGRRGTNGMGSSNNVPAAVPAVLIDPTGGAPGHQERAVLRAAGDERRGVGSPGPSRGMNGRDLIAVWAVLGAFAFVMCTVNALSIRDDASRSG